MKSLGGIPRKIVADRGVEKICVATAQRFFRRNSTDSISGFETFQYGRSVSNQRILMMQLTIEELLT